MSTVAVIQARTGSSRLPGKVMADIGGTPMLGRVIDRVSSAQTVDVVVVATTDDPSDDPVDRLARAHGAAVFRGSVFDVLDRFHGALEAFADDDEVVRITADCPFVDPGMIDEVVRLHRSSGADFTANRLPPPAARTVPVGLDVEVTSVGLLRLAWTQAAQPHHREHVMPYLYETPGFSVEVLNLEEDLSALRWTVDTPEDLRAARQLARVAGTVGGWRELVAVVRAHPEIASLNADVMQKSVHVMDERSDLTGRARKD